LTERVPLETFLLFSSALSVQSETGGSLAPTLASVGRTIRDRIEISRRIRSNSAQSQVSTIAVMMLTYFIALVVWRTNPEQMSQFLATSVGKWAVAGTVLMQAAGLVWMSFISRLRF
jgi:Flp pilus assembly protein TadB